MSRLGIEPVTFRFEGHAGLLTGLGFHLVSYEKGKISWPLPLVFKPMREIFGTEMLKRQRKRHVFARWIADKKGKGVMVKKANTP